MAHETLRLRAAHRHLARNGASEDDWKTWDGIIERESWNIVFNQLKECGNARIREACIAADHEALELELGPACREEVTREIRKRLKPYMTGGKYPNNAVLIGGPPCQAYSIVGRSRNRGQKDYVPELDHRHFLYEEYLHVITEFRPAVFVMENVKGILSSRVGERQIFEKILSDLRKPGLADGTAKRLEYVLVPLTAHATGVEPEPDDFLLKAEGFGVPQARHRVIILGVRKDVFSAAGTIRKLLPSPAPTVQKVIGDLESLRPQISSRGKGMHWSDALSLPLFDEAVRTLHSMGDQGREIAAVMTSARQNIQTRQVDPGPGAERSRVLPTTRSARLGSLATWYKDRSTTLMTNHESRAHMPSDLVRYLFVAAFGKATGSSPRLADFPRCLLPAHKNVDPDNAGESIFKDRFRVQLASRHSMTITSHIAKDGHAFIHYMPKQCRSLTVREAARLQTFPDSYVFLGNRTSQFTQVGNAVPPLLAVQIAEVVASVLAAAATKSGC